jgi:hypothetical protein
MNRAARWIALGLIAWFAWRGYQTISNIDTTRYQRAPQ